jgi:alanyl-tRNA synthetase
MLTSAEIRARFLAFFASKGHTVVPSGSLVPGSDPTLLFTNAGMVQFKDVFLGLEERGYSRAASSQKCMRVSGKHNDLESVGPSPRHHTFFEMLGNFSFGDYFKREAIELAWGFLIDELGMDPDRLWPTVFEEDDEAFGLWQTVAGVPAERITRLGAKENFWSMGDTGPCGPDSEIMYDRGPEACTCGRPDCSPAHECDRWLEFWNLVFMQFERNAEGEMTPLPRPSIDTGMGLERITAILQGADNNYDTDLFVPIMERTRELLGHDEATMREQLVAYRVIADHSRAIAFLVADGVLPSNEGRGYVTRMILRRAARYGRRLGFREPFLAETVATVIRTMGDHYAELRQRATFVQDVVQQEEERFLSQLEVGLARLDDVLEGARRSGARVVPGEEAFRLYDTYGFPLELTRDAAAEEGLSVDEEGFRLAMERQRARAREAQQFAGNERGELYRELAPPQTEFVGYHQLACEARVQAVVSGGSSVDRAGYGDEVEVVLDRTPFYGESGGQVGDHGVLAGPNGRVLVRTADHPLPGLTVHLGKVAEGTLAVGDEVEVRVDDERRAATARHHTATHLLHRALREVLGEHAAQAGSLVTPERLRFDFSHLSAVSRDELDEVERIVNREIRANRPVVTREMGFQEAVEAGAVALFGEKYGDRVRMVSVEGFSRELCGGTHVSRSGDIGTFLIVSESSIGSGLRRIEAVTGEAAETMIRQRLRTLDALRDALGGASGEELQRLISLQEQHRELGRRVQELERVLSARRADALVDKARDVSGATVLAAVVEVSSVDALREMVDRFRDKLGSAVVALGARIGEKPLLVVGITDDLVKRGLHAGNLAGAAARAMGGGGGGRPHMAQAGGRDAEALDEAIAGIPELIAETLG